MTSVDYLSLGDKAQTLREKANRILRKCYKCDGELYFINFIYPLSLIKMKILIKDYGFALLYEIWMNPMFILECCWCHEGVPRPKWEVENYE